MKSIADLIEQVPNLVKDIVKLDSEVLVLKRIIRDVVNGSTKLVKGIGPLA